VTEQPTATGGRGRPVQSQVQPPPSVHVTPGYGVQVHVVGSRTFPSTQVGAFVQVEAVQVPSVQVPVVAEPPLVAGMVQAMGFVEVEVRGVAVVLQEHVPSPLFVIAYVLQPLSEGQVINVQGSTQMLAELQVPTAVETVPEVKAQVFFGVALHVIGVTAVLAAYVTQAVECEEHPSAVIPVAHATLPSHEVGQHN